MNPARLFAPAVAQRLSSAGSFLSTVVGRRSGAVAAVALARFLHGPPSWGGAMEAAEGQAA